MAMVAERLCPLCSGERGLAVASIVLPGSSMIQRTHPDSGRETSPDAQPMPCKTFCISVGELCVCIRSDAGANYCLRSAIDVCAADTAGAGECLRSSNGAPGPSYWQNEADYELHATLDTAAKQLSTTEIITYTNNARMCCRVLWVQVEQNIYKKDSRSRIASGGEQSRAEGRYRCSSGDS